MKKILLNLLLGVLFLFPFSTSAFSNADGCAGNCTDCHKLEKKEADVIVKKLVPNGKIVDIKLSPVKSIWQIDVDADGKHGALFLDFSKKYLIAGQMVPVDTIGKMPPPAPAKVNFSSIPLKNAVVFGPKNAARKVVVITDPDCPYCRNLHAEMKKVLTARKDVAFYLMLYPLPMHKDAYKKVQAILCEKSVHLTNEAFEGKPVPEPKCSNEQVEKNKALVQKLGFNSTPTLIRDDGTVLNGFRPADQLSAWIDGK